MTGSGDVTLSEADYLRLIIHGTTAFELLRTAMEFDLFERLEAENGLTLEQVADAIGVAEQPARILLLGLASLSLVTREGERYVNSPVIRRKMLRDAPRFLGPLLDVQAEVINQSMGDFAESMRQGTNVGLRHIPGPGTTLYERLTAHPRLQEVFYANMGDASRKAFARILDFHDFSGVRHLVDLGGGDGTNGRELARRYPELTVTVVDQESVTRLASSRVEDPELLGRMRFHPGDLFTVDLPRDADAILFFHLFEIWSLERNTELLRRCHDALPEGGVCLVYNFVSNDEGTGSLSAGLVSPYFLTLASGEGMTYSPRDVERAVRDAGFSHVERHDDLGFSHTLVIGRK
ncbi:methyltransferase domain-containing protein [Actinoalloteichus sp. AHMU CJ021]|uniref:Dimerization domain-containing protein n=1 Tax=Actinoalloteichus caeruleus DSM 43889 TaxID=1120930 RepID=A0ABT1JE72_ACTCY|nr:methyltransferase [Actinoalloteichus caeruleus]AUS81274.1 methyltransferase domain-containing protein [Actinoalloteichus sp. AHMU CJ021]MCP2330795.1 dimerization domain-containing protein [Actinoalloteichus caeruleus DSM 43889]